MSNAVKKIANQFIKKHRIIAVDYSILKKVTRDIGFTIIEFNPILNDGDIQTIIENLNLDDAILRSRGFTYADNNYRLIFINEDLSDDEKIYVLSHELGHIACGHYTNVPILGKDVKEEYEANEFSHYLLSQNILRNMKAIIVKYKKVVIVFSAVMLVVLAMIIAGVIIRKEKSYYGNFYITTTGCKYHQAECIHIKNNNNVKRLTRKQFKSGEYEPCGTCLPNKE